MLVQVSGASVLQSCDAAYSQYIKVPSSLAALLGIALETGCWEVSVPAASFTSKPVGEPDAVVSITYCIVPLLM